MDKKIKVIAVAGPTASGKSDLAVKIAKKIGGEIVSCDSMQIYRDMQIGTAKITEDEKQGIEHYLLDFLEPGERFSVSDYVKLADEAVKIINNKGKNPIIAGGTGLYLKSFLYGVDFKDNSNSEKIRKELEEKANNGEIETLYEELKSLDEKAAENIHINNKKRVIRALEYCLTTGEKFSLQYKIEESKYDFLFLCLSYKNRQTLYDIIDKRVDLMIEKGLLDEAKRFMYLSECENTSYQAIGYKEFYPYLKNEISYEEALENVKRETRRYAKRQITWFKGQKDVNWLYIDDFENKEAVYNEALNICKDFLNKD